MRLTHNRIPGGSLLLVLLLGLLLLAPGAWAEPKPGGPDPGGRYCLWMLWLGDRSLLGPVQERLAQGEPFMVVARLTARRHPKKAKVSADCLEAAKLAPTVLQALVPLELGQVSQPFDLGGGVALVMRTTDAYRQRGQALYDQGKYAQAEKELLKDLKLHPAAAPTWHVVGLCRAARGDYPGALEALDQALKWTPANPALLNDKASILGLMGRKEEAREQFERALALDPKNPLIQSNLAWALYLQGRQLDRAEKLARQALDRQPDNPRFRSTWQKIQKARAQAARPKARAKVVAKAKPKKSKPSTRAAAKPRPKAKPRTKIAAKPKPKARPRSKTEPKPRTRVAAKSKPKPRPKARPARSGPEPEYPLVAVAGHRPVSLVPVRQPQAKPTPRPAAPAVQKSRPPAQAAQKPRAVTPPPGGYKVYIEIGAFRDHQRARREVNRWVRRGYATRMERWQRRSGQVWMRVMLGPFPDQAKASKMARRLKKKRWVQDYHLVVRPKGGG